MRKAAFTLIELLVVVAIIALLASIALPAFRSAMEKAHGTADANNLRQMGIGMTAYLGDHDDTMFGSTATSGSNSWAALIGPTTWGSTSNYITDAHVFQSPFDKRPYNGTNVSYGINSAITSASNSNTSSWHYPSALILIGPNATLVGSNLSFGTNTISAGTLTVTSGSLTGVMTTNTISNVLYVDSHVSSVQVKTVNAAGASSSTWMPQ